MVSCARLAGTLQTMYANTSVAILYHVVSVLVKALSVYVALLAYRQRRCALVLTHSVQRIVVTSMMPDGWCWVAALCVCVFGYGR